MFGATRSERSIRDEGRKGREYSLLIEPPLSDDEGVVQSSPLSAIHTYTRVPANTYTTPILVPSILTSTTPPITLTTTTSTTVQHGELWKAICIQGHRE